MPLPRAVLGLSLLTAASALLAASSYDRWDDKSCQGTPVLTKRTRSLMQCGAVCLSRGSECDGFVTQRTESGVLCELFGAIHSCTVALGVHIYSTADVVRAAFGYVDVGNGQYYKFVTGGGNAWQESVTECDQIFGSLFKPESYAEFEAVRAYRELHNLMGTLWVGLRHDVNYPMDIHRIEGHPRDNVNFCGTMVDKKDHMDYDDCDKSLGGKICKLKSKYVHSG